MPNPPDCDQTWKSAVFLAGASALVSIYSPQPFLTDLAREFQLAPSRASLALSATTFGIALAAPLAGAISDRFGRKRMILPALVALGGANLLCAFAPHFEWLLLFRWLQGLAIPFIFTVTIAYLAEEHPRADGVRLNALFVSGSVFGGFLGRFLSGLVAQVFGWRASFVALVGFLAASAAVMAVGLPRERRFSPDPRSLGAFHRRMMAHLRNPRMRATCLAGAALLFVQVGSFTYACLHLAAPPYGLGSAALGGVFGVFLLGMVATPLAGAHMADHGSRATFALAWAVSGCGLGVCLVPHAAAVVTGLALCSTGIFSGQACATRCAAEAAGAARSSGVGLYLSCYYLGGSLGSVAPWPVYQWLGWPGCSCLLLLVLTGGWLAARFTGVAQDPAPMAMAPDA